MYKQKKCEIISLLQMHDVILATFIHLR
jgi:hypothetical protein